MKDRELGWVDYVLAAVVVTTVLGALVTAVGYVATLLLEHPELPWYVSIGYALIAFGLTIGGGKGSETILETLVTVGVGIAFSGFLAMWSPEFVVEGPVAAIWVYLAWTPAACVGGGAVVGGYIHHLLRRRVDPRAVVIRAQRPES